MKLSVAVLCLMFVASCTAHMCLLSPQQRGTENDINKAGANDCLLITDGPCGGRSGSTPNFIMRKGMKSRVLFQKNLSHWNQANPGYFSLTIWPSSGSKVEVAKVADSNSPSLTLYNPTFVVPDSLASGNAILQAQYVTNNPNAPAVFYQCADVTIV